MKSEGLTCARLLGQHQGFTLKAAGLPYVLTLRGGDSNQKWASGASQIVPAGPGLEVVCDHPPSCHGGFCSLKDVLFVLFVRGALSKHLSVSASDANRFIVRVLLAQVL